MSGIAFYAPLKSPSHPTPSGDRQMARNLMKALERGLEQSVSLASELRSFEPAGSSEKQAELLSRAQAEVTRLCASTSPPALWVTYHNYYKAPDLIGPPVSAAFGIPYILIEASRAKSRLTGDWAHFAEKAEAASDAADVIFFLTEQDRFALERDRPEGQRITALPPFMDRHSLPRPSKGIGPILSVGMMRHGDKLASYEIIAETMKHVTTSDWTLRIVGDGPARPKIQSLFAHHAGHVEFVGARAPEDLEDIYADASLFFWPGVNEAFGMVYLEAQVAGLPIVAQDRPGVRDVLPPGQYPSPDDGPLALAKRLDDLLTNSTERRELSIAARDQAQAQHLMPAAAARLRDAILPMLEKRP